MNATSDPVAPASYELRDHEGRTYGHYQDETRARQAAEGHAASTKQARSVVRVETVWSSEAAAADAEAAAQAQQDEAERQRQADATKLSARATATAPAPKPAATKKPTKAEMAAAAAPIRLWP